jgi:hypothetical protein
MRLHTHTWPGHHPGESGYVESFHVKQRDELLNREVFYTPRKCRC